MIACLRGELFSRTEEKLIIMTGGVGYEMFATASCLRALPEIGNQVLVHAYTHVREDALLLYAFSSEEEKEIFLQLISVSGVGPKLALAILSGITAGELAAAIRSESVARLTKLPGVGKKTAERLCLELKDKMQWLPVHQEMQPAARIAGHEELLRDTVSALVNLGYPQNSAETAVRKAADETADTGKMTLEYLVRLALRLLA
ncbi:MAG: Holliday junction DNA helicase RuvA [Desulfobulbaceae bacterium DB1]|nr:MAG: Holliday junction DNA helicase RuvA [Desulfobulbaceae bacterium DB1]